MGAYSASKAAVEALGNTLRQELAPSGARVGVAYFAELDTDMTSRGFGTEAARQFLGDRTITTVTPLDGRHRRARTRHRPPGADHRRAVVGAPGPAVPHGGSTGRRPGVRRRVADVAAQSPATSRSSSPLRSRTRLVTTDRAGPASRPASRAGRRAPQLGLRAVSGRVAGHRRRPTSSSSLGRHRRLFRGWLRFAGRLMPGGKLPRRETELVILRVAHLRGCAYELEHHVHLGARAGITAADVERVQDGPDGARVVAARSCRCLPRSTSCTNDSDLTDEDWAELPSCPHERELIELVHARRRTTRCSPPRSPPCASNPTDAGVADRSVDAPAGNCPRVVTRSPAIRSRPTSACGSSWAWPTPWPRRATSTRPWHRSSSGPVCHGRPSTSCTRTSSPRFLEAFDLVEAVLMARLTAELDGPGEPLERLERAFATYLETLADEPGYARLFLVEVHAAGPQAMARRTIVQQRISDAIVDVLGAQHRRRPLRLPSAGGRDRRHGHRPDRRGRHRRAAGVGPTDRGARAPPRRARGLRP